MNFCGGDGGGGGGGCDENRQKIPRLSSNLVEDPDDYSETEKSDKASTEIDPGNDLETVKKMMVAKKIFSNHLILCSIFDNSSLTDVRHNFNRVNRTWRAATLHSLSNFQIVRLHLKMSYTLTYSEFSMKIFPANQTRPSITAIPLEPTTKDQFLEKMKDQTHKKVVWLSLTFETYYPSMSHDAFFMMTQIRPWVTRLQIEDNRRDFSDPLKYFKGELPNLEFLNINKMRPLFSLDEQNPSISLTALAQIKTLRFGTIDGSTATPSKWIPQILKTVPNVQKIYGYPFEFLQLLETVEVATVQKIKSVSVPNDSYFMAYEMSKKFEFWRNLNQPTAPYCLLTHLEVFKVPSQICKVEPTVRKTIMKNLSTMLNSNQLTIQTLELSAVNFLLKIPPKMPALTTLLVNDETDFEKDRRRKCPPRVFSNGFNLSDCCPKILNLEINMVDMGCVESLLPFKIFQNFHSNIDAPTMVRRLKIRQEKGIVGVRVLEGISKRCPQIVSLDVGNSRQWLEDCLPRIWTLWPHLEELTLSVTWHGSRFPRQYLDEAVTGICEEKCTILRQSIGRKEFRLEEFKKSPGISDMKRLKHFSINFDGYSLNGPHHVDGDEKYQQFFSQVSALYGFQMVTGLVVHFSIPFETPRWNQRFELDAKNMKKRLEDIIPFVQFAEINS